MSPEKTNDVAKVVRFALLWGTLAWLLYVIGNIIYDNAVMKPKREAQFAETMAKLKQEKQENNRRYEARTKLANEEVERCLDQGGIPSRGYTDHIVCIDRKVLIHVYEEEGEEAEAGPEK